MKEISRAERKEELVKKTIVFSSYYASQVESFKKPLSRCCKFKDIGRGGPKICFDIVFKDSDRLEVYKILSDYHKKGFILAFF